MLTTADGDIALIDKINCYGDWLRLACPLNYATLSTVSWA